MANLNDQRLKDIANYQRVLAQYTNPVLSPHVQGLVNQLDALKDNVAATDFVSKFVQARQNIQNFTTSVEQSGLSPTGEEDPDANPQATEENEIETGEVPAPDNVVVEPEEEDLTAGDEEPVNVNTGPEELEEEPEGVFAGSENDTTRPSRGSRLRREIFGREGNRPNNRAAQQPDQEAQPNLSNETVVTSSRVVAARAQPDATNSFSPRDFARVERKRYLLNYLKGMGFVAGGHTALAFIGMAVLGPTAAAVLATVLGVTGVAKLLKRTVEFATNTSSITRVIKNTEPTRYTVAQPERQQEQTQQGQQEQIEAQDNEPVAQQPQANPAREALYQEYVNEKERHVIALEEYNTALASNSSDPSLLPTYQALMAHRENVLKPLHEATVNGNDEVLNRILQERAAANNEADAENGVDEAQVEQPDVQNPALANEADDQTADTVPLATAATDQNNDQPNLNEEADIGHTQQVSAIYGERLVNNIGRVRDRQKKTMRGIGQILTVGAAAAGLYMAYKGLPNLFEWNNAPMKVNPGQNPLATLGEIAFGNQYSQGLLKAGALLIGGIVAWKCRGLITGPFLNSKTPQLDAFERQVNLVEENNPPDYRDRGAGRDPRGNFLTTASEIVVDTVSTPVGGGYSRKLRT